MDIGIDYVTFNDAYICLERADRMSDKLGNISELNSYAMKLIKWNEPTKNTKKDLIERSSELKWRMKSTMTLLEEFDEKAKRIFEPTLKGRELVTFNPEDVKPVERYNPETGELEQKNPDLSYDPETGKWTTIDPWTGEVIKEVEPLGLNVGECIGEDGIRFNLLQILTPHTIVKYDYITGESTYINNNPDTIVQDPTRPGENGPIYYPNDGTKIDLPSKIGPGYYPNDGTKIDLPSKIDPSKLPDGFPNGGSKIDLPNIEGSIRDLPFEIDPSKLPDGFPNGGSKIDLPNIEGSIRELPDIITDPSKLPDGLPRFTMLNPETTEKVRPEGFTFYESNSKESSDFTENKSTGFPN